MKIIGITACTAGIAHTYIVAEKIQQAATEAGHECKIETQGTIGAQNEWTPEDIKAADVSVAMKSPKSLIATIEKKLGKK